jgi:hypothetical protein
LTTEEAIACYNTTEKKRKEKKKKDYDQHIGLVGK